ncbi:MAG TPA: hypothetical protein VJG32_18670 [Anaerolineae bacterium]|nr:hypothetical protein [Anaerolineae bacterium]
MNPSRARLFNTLTLTLLILTLLLCVAYTALFALTPSAAEVAALATNTPGPTATPTLPPTVTRTPRSTNTPTNTLEPSPTLTATPVITQTLSGTRTPTLTPTPGPSPTPAPTLSPFNYVVSVEYQRSIYGLNWAGIAGLVIGLDGKQQTNILVRAWGDAPLGAAGQEIASGLAPQYGVSGFEFTLGDRPVTGDWNVQLLGDDGQPLSDVVAIEMNDDPRSNLAFVIFEQNH